MKAYGKHREQLERAEYERMRYIAFACLAPHSKEINRPTDVFRFDDEKAKQIKVDEVDWDEAERKAKKILARKR